MALQNLRNNVFTGFVALAMLVGGFGLTGCDIFQQDENQVSVQIPNVGSIANTVKSLAQLATAFYVSEEDAEAISGVVDYVCDNIENASGSTSKFMLNTIDESIKSGKCPEYTRFLMIGVVHIMDEYFDLKGFNIDDCVVVLRAFSSGLKKSDVSAQSVVLDW